MLLSVIVFVLAVASAAPPTKILNYSTDNVQVLRYENDNLGGGNYRYAFEQSDGTKHEQEGELRSGGGDQEENFLIIRGVYSWVGPDGVTYSVTYLADENGYKANIEQGPGGVIPEAVIG